MRHCIHHLLLAAVAMRLSIPDLQVCDQLLLEMNFTDTQGNRFIEQVYLTVQALPESTPLGRKIGTGK